MGYATTAARAAHACAHGHRTLREHRGGLLTPLALAYSTSTYGNSQNDASSTSQDAQAAATARLSRLFSDEQYIVKLFQEARKSVAHIAALKQNATSPLQMDPGRLQPGAGSAFVWDRSGHIVTNFHVIQNSVQATVTLSNQSSYNAQVVGVDQNNDLAVLKIPQNDGNLQPLSLGTSHDLLVGQKVFAIGNPFGLDQTLTGGIVSSVGRQIQGITGRIIRDVIQTDAAVNPGNSGGPLLDSLGRLIGINTMIYSSSGSSAGISFAVPVNTVRRSVSQIISHGKLIKGSVGLFLLPDQTSIQLLPTLGIKRGVIIQQVVPGSGAEQAGLQGCTMSANGRVEIGDVILEVGRERVKTCEDVKGIIEQFNVGDQVPVTVLRGREQHTLNVPIISAQS